MSAWSVKKVSVTWTAVILLVLVIAITVVILTRTISASDTERMDTCLHTGNSVAECSVALP